MAKTTKLDAVNTVLSNIGQAPVTNLESGNPMVEMAQLIIDEISRTVQAEGWSFNTEYGYPFIPNGNKEIIIPDNVLSLDTAPVSRHSAQIRRGKLYNRVDHTFEWGDSKVELDVVWEFDFEDLPEAFKNYIVIRAANVFAGRSVGSTEAVRFGQAEEMQARAGMLEYETQQGDYNIFGTDKAITQRRTYRPEYTINRF